MFERFGTKRTNYKRTTSSQRRSRRPPFPHGARPKALDLGIEGITDAVADARGGFSIVYRATQVGVGRTVAVKILRIPVVGDAERRRFRDEARALGALSSHPHIVPVINSGVSSKGEPYLVMDYLPGGTLAERLGRHGRLGWEEVADIGVKLGGALASAHAVGVLHRDLKPENVLLSGFGEPQIVDFGIARLAGTSDTRSGILTASLAHAAPEVLAGRPASEASDVYSLASTLYTLLAGHTPFARSTDESLDAIVTRAVNEEPADLEPGVPSALREVIFAGLTNDPGVRTPTALALTDALQTAQRAAGCEATTPVLPAASHHLIAPPNGDVDSHTVDSQLPRPLPRPGPSPLEISRSPQRWRRAALTATAAALVVAAAVVVAGHRDSSGSTATAPVVASAAATSSTLAPPSPASPSTTASPTTDATSPASTAPQLPLPPSTPTTAPPATTTPPAPPPNSPGPPPRTSPPPPPTTVVKLVTAKHVVGLVCQTKGSQLCLPAKGYSVTTQGVLRIKFQASAKACSKVRVHLFVGGYEYWVSKPLGAQEEASYDVPTLAAGSYQLGLEGEGVPGGCNHGQLSVWGGTLTVTTSA